MSDHVFPYDTLSEPLNVSLQEPRFDARTYSVPMRNVDERIVKLYENASKWELVQIDLTVSTSREAIDDLVRKVGPIAPFVIADCRPTNTRQTFSLRDSGTGRWQTELELSRDNFRDRVELRTFLAADIGGQQRPVAFGDSWYLHFDEPSSIQLRGSLDVRWVNFETAEDLSLRQFSGSTHMVSLNKNLPQIWLNSGFDGLEPMLRDRKDRTGTDRALHDLLRIGIARSVWMSLVSDALAAVPSFDDDDSEEPEWPEKEWHTEVLKRVLPAIAPDKTEMEWLRSLATQWKEQPGASEFFSRAEAAVGDLLRANASLRRIVQQQNQGEAP